jgi:hypothetical protein
MDALAGYGSDDDSDHSQGTDSGKQTAPSQPLLAPMSSGQASLAETLRVEKDFCSPKRLEQIVEKLGIQCQVNPT